MYSLWGTHAAAPLVLLPVPKGKRNFKMTYLEAQMELEGILADLAFSARVIFFHHFVFKNFDSEKSYLDFKSFSFELRCRSEFY